MNYLVKKINNGQYISNNSVAPINGINVNNINSESAYVFTVNNSILSNYEIIAGEYGTIGGVYNEDMFGSLQTTGTILYSLMNYKTDVHVNFDKQIEFIAFPKFYNINNLSKVTVNLGNVYYVFNDFNLLGGDTVITDNCYLAYGLKGNSLFGSSYKIGRAHV